MEGVSDSQKPSMHIHGSWGGGKSATNTENKLQVNHRFQAAEAEVAHGPSILTCAATFLSGSHPHPPSEQPHWPPQCCHAATSRAAGPLHIPSSPLKLGSKGLPGSVTCPSSILSFIALIILFVTLH